MIDYDQLVKNGSLPSVVVLSGILETSSVQYVYMYSKDPTRSCNLRVPSQTSKQQAAAALAVSSKFHQSSATV